MKVLAITISFLSLFIEGEVFGSLSNSSIVYFKVDLFTFIHCLSALYYLEFILRQMSIYSYVNIVSSSYLLAFVLQL